LERREQNRCLSCGASENMGRRRYCSVECRQALRRQLDLRTGLLRALNTRYASFYFTEWTLALNVLRYDSSEIFSFLYPRLPGRKPSEDFWWMAEELGRIWWDEKRRSNRDYLASRVVFERAMNGCTSLESVRPLEVRRPVGACRSLTCLELSHLDLRSPKALELVKSAYRKQAKTHHPDIGGDADLFRKIRRAYEELMEWIENPVFSIRRGIPDKWCYLGESNRWIQPAPCWK